MWFMIVYYTKRGSEIYEETWAEDWSDAFGYARYRAQELSRKIADEVDVGAIFDDCGRLIYN